MASFGVRPGEKLGHCRDYMELDCIVFAPELAMVMMKERASDLQKTQVKSWVLSDFIILGESSQWHQDEKGLPTWYSLSFYTWVVNIEANTIKTKQHNQQNQHNQHNQQQKQQQQQQQYEESRDFELQPPLVSLEFLASTMRRGESSTLASRDKGNSLNLKRQ